MISVMAGLCRQQAPYYVLRVRCDKSLDYHAGQYVELSIDGKHFYPFSIANAPRDQQGYQSSLAIVETTGSYSFDILLEDRQQAFIKKLLNYLAEGDKPLLIAGAFGKLTLLKKSGDVLLFAEDVGISPMLALVEQACCSHYDGYITLCWLAKKDIFSLHTQLKQLTSPKFSYHRLERATWLSYYQQQPYIYACTSPSRLDAISQQLLAQQGHANNLYADLLDYQPYR